jgi:hypothetical protein
MTLELNKNLNEQRPPEAEKPESDRMRPFDTHELEKLPKATDQDPPYRPWWAVDWT